MLTAHIIYQTTKIIYVRHKEEIQTTSIPCDNVHYQWLYQYYSRLYLSSCHAPVLILTELQ